MKDLSGNKHEYRTALEEIVLALQTRVLRAKEEVDIRKRRILVDPTQMARLTEYIKDYTLLQSVYDYVKKQYDSVVKNG